MLWGEMKWKEEEKARGVYAIVFELLEFVIWDFSIFLKRYTSSEHVLR